MDHKKQLLTLIIERNKKMEPFVKIINDYNLLYIENNKLVKKLDSIGKFPTDYKIQIYKDHF